MSETIRGEGAYRLHKADPARKKREHPTFEAAEAEAKRIQASYPDENFIIAQEVGRVIATKGEGA